METQKHTISLNEEQEKKLLLDTGAKDIEEALKITLYSKLNLEILFSKLKEYVPTLTDENKEEFKTFLCKKFELVNKNKEEVKWLFKDLKTK